MAAPERFPTKMPSPFASNDERWAAVVNRDRSAGPSSSTPWRRPASIAVRAARPDGRGASTCASTPPARTPSAPAQGHVGGAVPTSHRSRNAMRKRWRCVSSHPYGGGVAGSRRPRWSCRHEPVPLPPHIQGRHRLHAAGVRRRPSRGPDAQRAAYVPNGHRRHLRRRVQLERPVLRGFFGDLRMAPATFMRGGPGETILLPSASARSARYWRQRPQRGCARSCSATIRMPWCTSWRTVSHGRARRGRAAIRIPGGPCRRLRRSARVRSRAAA